MVMPDEIEIYVPLTGSKLHLQPHCGGLNKAKKETIDEVDFLERLEAGQGCKRCCGSDMMTERIKRILKRRRENRMNFLEQLAAEWYEFNGCLVRTNIRYGKLKSGGYEGEMDVVAYDPKTKNLIHIETSDDADSWAKRNVRFHKKFKNASKYYKDIFPLDIKEIKRIGIVGYVYKTKYDLGKDIELILVPHFIRHVTESMKEFPIVGRAIPESYPLLRAFQHAYWFGTFEDKDRISPQTVSSDLTRFQ